MTRPGIEPRSPGPLANTLTNIPMGQFHLTGSIGICMSLYLLYWALLYSNLRYSVSVFLLARNYVIGWLSSSSMNIFSLFFFMEFFPRYLCVRYFLFTNCISGFFHAVTNRIGKKLKIQLLSIQTDNLLLIAWSEKLKNWNIIPKELNYYWNQYNKSCSNETSGNVVFNRTELSYEN